MLPQSAALESCPIPPKGGKGRNMTGSVPCRGERTSESSSHYHTETCETDQVTDPRTGAQKAPVLVKFTPTTTQPIPPHPKGRDFLGLIPMNPSTNQINIQSIGTVGECCTSDITLQDTQLLNKRCISELYARNDYGYILFCNPKETTRNLDSKIEEFKKIGFSERFIQIYGAAHQAGHRYLMIDNAASPAMEEEDPSWEKANTLSNLQKPEQILPTIQNLPLEALEELAEYVIGGLYLDQKEGEDYLNPDKEMEGYQWKNHLEKILKKHNVEIKIHQKVKPDESIRHTAALAVLSHDHELNWDEAEGPDAGVGVNYYYVNDVTGQQAYINDDQGNVSITIENETVWEGAVEDINLLLPRAQIRISATLEEYQDSSKISAYLVNPAEAVAVEHSLKLFNIEHQIEEIQEPVLYSVEIKLAEGGGTVQEKRTSNELLQILTTECQIDKKEAIKHFQDWWRDGKLPRKDSNHNKISFAQHRITIGDLAKKVEDVIKDPDMIGTSSYRSAAELARTIVDLNNDDPEKDTNETLNEETLREVSTEMGELISSALTIARNCDEK